MKSISRILLYICLSIVPLCNGEIIKLTDTTFEHQTQASTGMTTGSWFIFFKANQCPHCEKIYPEFVKLSEDEDLKDKGIVLAIMDVPSNRATATRFDIRGFPSFLYFHKGKMYTVTGKRDYETWKFFLTDGIHAVQDSGVPIPPPMSGMEQFVKTLRDAGREFMDAASGKQGSEGYLIVALISILVLVMGGLMSLCFLPAKKSSAKKGQ